MTKLWGPLGWMTLHSISAIYPENPSQEDKLILKRFLDLFSETITCSSCKSHFKNMYQSYTLQTPTWWNSRYDLFLFIARAHNTVNLRLDKPRPSTIQESIDLLKMNTRITSGSEFRNRYIAYLINNWVREAGGEGMIQAGNARQMQKINIEYWTPRDRGYDTLSLKEGDILSPIVTIPKYYSPITGAELPRNIPQPKVGVSLRGGKFSLFRR